MELGSDLPPNPTMLGGQGPQGLVLGHRCPETLREVSGPPDSLPDQCRNVEWASGTRQAPLGSDAPVEPSTNGSVRRLSHMRSENLKGFSADGRQGQGLDLSA